MKDRDSLYEILWMNRKASTIDGNNIEIWLSPAAS